MDRVEALQRDLEKPRERGNSEAALGDAARKRACIRPFTSAGRDMAQNRIVLITDQNFGERLNRLGFQIPIWIINSLHNDAAISEAWKRHTANVTSFRPTDFGELLAVIDEHHPNWGSVEVHGPYPQVARTVLAKYGNGMFTETTDGFLFQKRNDS